MLKRCSSSIERGVPAALRILVCAALMAPLSGCQRQPEEAPPLVKQVFHLNPYEKDFGYSQAVLIGKTLYISGTVAVDAHGRLVAPGDMAGQMRAAYSNIQRTLSDHGVGFNAVLKETIYTTDMDAFLKAADLRFEYYDKEQMPATSWVQVQRLIDPGFLVQIEAVVQLP